MKGYLADLAGSPSQSADRAVLGLVVELGCKADFVATCFTGLTVLILVRFASRPFVSYNT